MNKKKTKNFLTYTLLFLLVPIIVLLSGFVFKEKYYAFLSVVICILSCVPLFYTFNKKENTSKELSVLAVLVAISVVGRFIFSPIPFFKPVTAITVITAVYLGSESGFAVGALSAIISNIYFGQGPWTPFQMLAWGLIGFCAGYIGHSNKNKKLKTVIYGAFSGIAYSLIMDIFTTLWMDGSFNGKRYLGAIISAIPITLIYMVSNVIFIYFLYKPFGDKLERIKIKYGLFNK